LSSAPDQLVGHVTIRIPIWAVTDSESWEIPKEYTYLAPGDAELVSHDIPVGWHESLREELIESGISYAEWTDEELAAKSTLPEEPPATAQATGLLSPTKGLVL
jgi:hypothetical protein